MLPATIAPGIREQVMHYLAATFHFRDPEVERELRRFLNDPENGLFKGPWIQVRLPFRPADAGYKDFFAARPGFHPFKHQWRSWSRLHSSESHAPVSTLVTTGTGSGKTECFLFPLLDHCLRMRRNGREGVKAIVLYPMNALANDQAARFAKEILQTKEYREAGLRVGLYIGRDDPTKKTAAKKNAKNKLGSQVIEFSDGGKREVFHAIDDRAELQENPPDILLTNYKMLDYLLMRPEDQRIWRFNEAGVLRYLVLDELHTYDGAQGSDVACLIRRLKERMEVARGDLCCVGTSATIKGEDGPNALLHFAGKLFEEQLAADAIIEEDRLTVAEVISNKVDDGTADLPSPVDCAPLDDENSRDYALRQAQVWSGPVCADAEDASGFLKWQLELGGWLKRNSLFKVLIEAVAAVDEEKALTWPALVKQVCNTDWRMRKLAAASGGMDAGEAILHSLLALVHHAREERSGNPFPIAPTQVQIWIRELRRLGRMVSPTPIFSWLDDKTAENAALPAFHCSLCGESGWISFYDPDAASDIAATGAQGFQLLKDPQQIYQAFFLKPRHQRILIVSPCRDAEAAAPAPADGKQLLFEDNRYYLSPASLIARTEPGPCPTTGSATFPVRIDSTTRKLDNGAVAGDQRCPGCGESEGIFIVGSQAATIGSVALDEMFGTVLNSDPKLLAFTDSVQDASHRAGFFTARTYHFTYRTALQHLIDDCGADGVPLNDVGKRLLEFWSEPKVGRPGAIREAIATLLPTDMIEYPDYREFTRVPGHGTPAPALLKVIEDRLVWEATSEFSLMLTHGRTMELNGASCLAWDTQLIDRTAEAIRREAAGIDPLLRGLDEKRWQLWLLGLLHRFRERGALNHEYLLPWARSFSWGKFDRNKRAIPNRESYPPAGRFRPRLITNFSSSAHDNVFQSSTGNKEPWMLRWGRRCFETHALPDTTLNDLMREFLKISCETGLLTKVHADGSKDYYAISASAARLISGGHQLLCSETNNLIVRPEWEEALWDGSPSLAYASGSGVYHPKAFSEKQRYYQKRYRKGALRRIKATEHTGLLTAAERESVEEQFKYGKQAEVPNVLACTSTLEMGIDIGDLSSTMLCSIPPTTASYLQRIGRAGRSTGTALILSLVNQQPHDLFFFARPEEMLRGRVEPPGCWLDASAVLVRQYLGFCIDQAVKAGALVKIPPSSLRLDEDLNNPDGHMPRFFAWVTEREEELRTRFLGRFSEDVQADTRDKFLKESTCELLKQRIWNALKEFTERRKELVNSGERLKKQKEKLDPAVDEDELREVDREIRMLKARRIKLDRLSTLELLTNAGLLPNYAFPERGVPFTGVVYNLHRGREQEDDREPFEAVRASGIAIRELAPANRFYTHSRVFDVQQLAIGNEYNPLILSWAICANCGHMRPAEELDQPSAKPACPQCGNGTSQCDIGQRKQFLELARSETVSYMENYESLSADKAEERDIRYYQIVNSFDTSVDSISGAVAEESLPFGIEFRSSLAMRQINAGYYDQSASLAFGHEVEVPENGFSVCRHCGVVMGPNEKQEEVKHRRSCFGRKKTEQLRQRGKKGSGYEWESLFLYRELNSEAIRLLLPEMEQGDISTLSACLHLGLRLRFQGNPSHLSILPHDLPDANGDLVKHYLVLMDGVPGGTGFLKALYQEKDEQGREGHGLVDVMQRALDTLEACSCRKLSGQPTDTDGCYRCLRNYQMQFRADEISRERGIRLLRDILEAAQNRTEKKALDEINVTSLFGSVLEKKFVERLRDKVVLGAKGAWEQTVVKGSKGYRFTLPGSPRVWDLELQPLLDQQQGVMKKCQPDFLLSCDAPEVKPVAIFLDGFEFHCHPGEATSRLSDDMQKRRAILESGNYHLWAVTWKDLADDEDKKPESFTLHPKLVKAMKMQSSSIRTDNDPVPEAGHVTGNGFTQLTAFLSCPQPEIWRRMVSFAIQPALTSVQQTATCDHGDLQDAIAQWRGGADFPKLQPSDGGDWAHAANFGVQPNDFLAYATEADVLTRRADRYFYLLRLRDDADSRNMDEFELRWRRFLCVINLVQFSANFGFWTTAELDEGTAPEPSMSGESEISPAWADVLDQVVSSLRPLVTELSRLDIAIPEVEFFDDDLGDELFAEMAWPNRRVALLTGDQMSFAEKWQKLSWTVVTAAEVQAQGVEWLAKKLS